MVFSRRSIPVCMIFLLSFDPPANATSGSSSSLFICPAIAPCALAMASVSPRTTSKDDRREPNSVDPRGFRQRARSLRAYSSSMAARTVYFIRISAHLPITMISPPFGARTVIERLKFITRNFGSVHAFKHGPNTCVILAPEVVGNYSSIER